MKTTMNHKGYEGFISYDDEAKNFHGEVLGIRDVVTFEGDCMEELEQAFRESVDEYLAFCAEKGQMPDKPFSGRVVIRMGPNTHEKAAIKAKEKNMSMNKYLVSVIERDLQLA